MRVRVYSVVGIGIVFCRILLMVRWWDRTSGPRDMASGPVVSGIGLVVSRI